MQLEVCNLFSEGFCLESRPLSCLSATNPGLDVRHCGISVLIAANNCMTMLRRYAYNSHSALRYDSIILFLTKSHLRYVISVHPVRC